MLQIALHNFQVQLRVKFNLGSLRNIPPPPRSHMQHPLLLLVWECVWKRVTPFYPHYLTPGADRSTPLRWADSTPSQPDSKDQVDNLSRPVFISSRLTNIPLFELSRPQIIQLICVFISPKLQLAGYLVEISIQRYLGLVFKIFRYLAKYPATCPVRFHQHEDSHYARTLSKISWAQVSSFEVKSRADEDAIFGIISQIKNSGLFGNLKLMK